jgi:hypothetical protein
MKINRMAEENIAPEWFENNKSNIKSEFINSEDFSRIASMKDAINDDELVIERDQIEICVSSKKPYLYNNNWSKEAKSSLREYAIVVGMDMSKFKAVNPASLKIDKDIIEAKVEASMIRTASTTANKLILDPFKLDEKLNKEDKKDQWEVIAGSSSLKEKPSMLSNAIKNVRGGENYYENSNLPTAQGRNSLTDPNAIGKLAANTKEDTGVRLKRENKEKQDAISNRKNIWQAEKIASMPGSEIIPKGTVFPTESMNANPGIYKGNNNVAYSKFDKNAIPEKTAGELLASSQKNRKESIQRETKQDHSFGVQKESARSISDNFGDELKKYLKK